MLERPTDLELRATQDHFGFRLLEPVEKDWYVVQAMQAIRACDITPFRLVFAGGTCLARAQRLVERMSEDVDFKVVPPAAPMSSNQRRRALGRLRGHLATGLTAAGFTLAKPPRSHDANQYTVLHLGTGTGSEDGARGPLRATIQIELSLAALREPTTLCPVVSFVNQAFGRQPEIAEIECVAVSETAAEKAVSLTRRTAMEIVGASRTPDPTLVRHIYDLHMVRGQVDGGKLAALMRAIAAVDAGQFGHQHPAYRDDIAGETHKAMNFLASNPGVRTRYEEFVAAMVYGQAAPFDEAIETVAGWVAAAWP